MTWTTTCRPETVISMDESRQHDDDRDLTWSRFWLGIGCVLAFVIASMLLVIAISGTRAGADYGLMVLIVILLARLVDGIVLARRRNR